jgi:cytoskeletal protein RodZ
VKTRIQSLSLLATLAIVVGMISWGGALNAQTTPSSSADQQQPQTQPPDTPPTQQSPQTQPTPSPDAPPATQQPPDAQAPDQAQAPSSKATKPAATDSQTFSGTIVKSGEKYVLKDDAGHTYDIDHQDDVKKFEGKRVRVQGTLDSTGKKIQVQ